MNPAGIGKYLLNAAVTMVAGRAAAILQDGLTEAKEEVQEKLKGLGVGLALVAVAGSILFISAAVLLSAAVLGLATVWPAWLAALTIGGGFLLVSLILIAIGASKINKNKDLRPEKAIANLRKYVG